MPMAVKKTYLLLNIMIFYDIFAFIVEVIDFSCKDFLKNIIYVYNLKCLEHLMLRHSVQFFISRMYCLIVFCYLKAKIEKNIKSIQKIMFIIIFILMIQYILS